MTANHSLCLLNCVEDAKSFVSEFKKCHHEWTVVSTHGAVNDFLATEGVACLELSSTVSNDFLKNAFQIADDVVKKSLNYLDKLYAQKISNILGIRVIDYFYPLYVYLGKYEYLTLLKIKKALEVIFDETSFTNFLVYSPIQQSYLKNGWIFLDNITKIVSEYDCSIEIRDNNLNKNVNGIKNSFQKFIGATRSPFMVINKVRGYIDLYFPKKTKCREPLILLLEPLYDLFFLKDVTENENILIWPYQRIPKVSGIEPKIDERFWDMLAFELMPIKRTTLRGNSSDVQELFVKSIISNFFENLRESLFPLLHIDQLYRQNRIGAVLWGSPPIMGSKALIVEYLLRNEIPVAGMQHGGSYVVQNCMDVHFDSDFNNCSHYLSYGFDSKDLRKTYPTKNCKCEIIPVGSYKEHINENKKVFLKKRQSIDILFPITNSLSFLEEAFRNNANQLNTIQRELIEFLDSFSNIRICIKPFVGYGANNCSTIHLFNKLKNVKILSKCTLIECINKFTIRAVVLDFPSTPLFEVLGKDIDIFLLADPVLPFSKEALALLKKRVYFFEDLGQLKSSLKKYLAGDLAVLRNNEFYNKYVYRENTKELILGTIFGLYRDHIESESSENGLRKQPFFNKVNLPSYY